MHHDPECSTMILAPNYTNQLELIERLSKNIPVDCVLAVKEHIPMVGHRPKGFYQKIKSFPNVHLISPYVSGFTMIQNSVLNAVITGTAGFESLLLQKKTLCFGRVNYHVINEGFTYCENPNNLAQSIIDSLKQLPADDHKIETYVACILKYGFECKSEYLGNDVDSKMIESSQKFIADLSERLMTIAKA